MKITTMENKKINPQSDFPYKTFEDLPLYEQRYLPRWQANRKGYCRTHNKDTFFKTQVSDLTLSGACIYISADIEPKQKLKLSVHLSEKHTFEARGIVIWKNILNKEVLQVGIRFNRLSLKAENLLLRYAFHVDNNNLEKVFGEGINFPTRPEAAHVKSLEKESKSKRRN